MPRITKIEATRTAHRKKLRVAAYARVSTNREHQLASLETQKKHYEKYIKARSDWEYTGLYFDEGISGTKMEKRDGLLRLLEDCDKGLIDFIVVKSISRFSRNTVECIETVRKLCDKGIHMPMACRNHYRSSYINCTGSGNSCNFFRKHLTRFTEKSALLKRNTQREIVMYGEKCTPSIC